MLLERFFIRHGSGGRGRYRGGHGAVRRVRFLERMQAAIVAGHRRVPPYGLRGGAPGAVGRNWVQRSEGTVEELPGCAETVMDSRRRVRHRNAWRRLRPAVITMHVEEH